MRSTTPRLALLLLLPTLAATQRSSCGPPSSAAALHAAGYAPDHLNYLCTNWTRPTPLPCSPARTGWQPRWGKRFVITAWWPPLPSDYEAYADAGFNLALLRGDTWLNRAQEQAYAEGRGPEWHATHDGLFEAVLEESRLLAEKGVMSVFTQVQLVGDQQPRATQAYGNRTGGVVRAGSNITTHAYQSFKNHFDTGDVRSYMETVPEVEYFLSELERRNISHRFGGLFLADDTVTQASNVIEIAEYLKEHAPWLIPMVNQVGGNSGPETLYRSKLFISGARMTTTHHHAIPTPHTSPTPPSQTPHPSLDPTAPRPAAAPEEYPISGCLGGECQPGVPITPETLRDGRAINASAGAAAQQAAYQSNAFADMRFGLEHWPLFQVGAGNGPLNWTNGTSRPVPPDAGGTNVRSDSLVRWMVYAAIAYGARGLNYYCWGGGVYYAQTCSCPGAAPPSGRQGCGCNTSKAGRPTPIYATVREVNADASAWGDLLLGGDYRFAAAYHSPRSWGADAALVGPAGNSTPSERTLVTSMSDDLLATVFLPDPPSPASPSSAAAASLSSAYLFVVSKRVSPYLAPLAPRNVTLSLHPSVAAAAVVPPGEQGRTGFSLGGAPPAAARHPPRRRRHYAAVHATPRGLAVTVELVGGGGALVRLDGKPAALQDAAYGAAALFFDPAAISLAPDRSGGSELKAPDWAYGSFAFGGQGQTGYMPLDDLELESGLPFEAGEQSAFFIGGGLDGRLAGPHEARAWAWAGFNLLSLPAPSREDSAAYGEGSAAFGELLDWGYSYGYFGLLAAAEGRVLSGAHVRALVDNFRCHGRMGGLILASNATDGAATAAAAATLRSTARGAWLLPFATASSAAAAVALGGAGVPLAMPAVRPTPGGAAAQAAAIAAEYGAMYLQLRAAATSSFDAAANRTLWRAGGKMVFVAALDACGFDSDSLLRWQAFAALAFGARGVYWRGARACAGVGTAKFALLRSINARIKAWGDVFVSSADPAPGPHGYNISRITTGAGWPMPEGAGVTRPSEASLVEAMDANVLVAELGAQGRDATPLIYVVNREVSLERGGAPVREVRVWLRGVAGSQPLEGDCRAGQCQCGMGVVGRELRLKLPGGSGQLVALSMLNRSLLDPPEREGSASDRRREKSAALEK